MFLWFMMLSILRFIVDGKNCFIVVSSKNLYPFEYCNNLIFYAGVVDNIDSGRFEEVVDSIDSGRFADIGIQLHQKFEVLLESVC